MRQTPLFSQPRLQLMPNQWDILAFLLVLCLIIMLLWAGSHMSMPFQLGQVIPISLSPWMLPQYALQTVVRMFIALFFSFLFSFSVATLAAKNPRAGRLIIPIIDILQSVPILGYLSIAVVAFIALFPGSFLGPECAVIFVVFTSQVWNMTLSFYQSLRTVPVELLEATHVYQLSAWQRFWRLEVPFGMPGLLWNAMMSMSGSWFFIVAAEAISIGNQNISVPGIGSYIALAITQESTHAIFYAIITMLVVILLYDQLFFRPLVAWSEKFKFAGASDEETRSWVLDIFQRSRLSQATFVWIYRFSDACVNFPLFKHRKKQQAYLHQERYYSTAHNLIWYSLIAILLVTATVLLWRFIYLNIPMAETGHVVLLGFYTAVRVFVSILLCSLVWVPVGVWVGMRPQIRQWVQPVAQILAAFPMNLFFPLIVIVILHFHLNFEIWSAFLMAMGTQWYILFNVIAGASSIPKELELAAKNMQLSGWLKWKRFLIPAVFPYYVTGAITAAGGSWNASIVSEVIQWGHTTLVANGLGSYITENTNEGHFAAIALGIVVMCAWVTLINFLFWRRLYRFAENRYRLG